MKYFARRLIVKVSREKEKKFTIDRGKSDDEASEGIKAEN